MFSYNIINWNLTITAGHGGGHGWGAAEESTGGGHEESPVSFEGGDHGGYALSGGEDYGSEIGGHGGY